MKKFLIGLLTGLVLAVLSVVILGFSLRKIGDRSPSIPSEGTLVLKLEGDVPEKPGTEIPIPFFQSQTPLTVRDNWEMLRRAATDNRIKAVVLVPHNVGAGWAKLQELREGLLAFRKSGKPLVALLLNPGMREYYLATAADKIYMSRQDLLNVKGLRAELMYVRGTLDKLGVKAEVEHAGKYKDAGDMFTQTEPSPETREVMNSMLDGIYKHLLETVAVGRKKNVADVQALIDQGPFLAEKAKTAGLVDEIAFEDEVYEQLKGRLKQKELKRVATRDYARDLAGTPEGKHRIAYLVGDGTITRGSVEGPVGDDQGITPRAFNRLLRQVSNDKEIKGVIIRVDSPGGDGIASDEILREVKLLSKKKPVVISMSDVAASGGYYIAMTGDPVIAYPNTITGSIGVIFGKVNLRGLYDKLGIQKELFSRGKFADVDSDYQPLSEAGRAKLREGLDDFYREFVQVVAEGRKQKYEVVEPLAQGRVWLGSQAKSNGLIDDVGGIEKAIEIIRKKANLGVAETVRLVPYPPKKTIFDQMFAPTQEVSVEAHVQKLVPGLDLRLWARGGFMHVMPWVIEIR